MKFSAIPSTDNPARPLQKNNPKGLQDELARHVREDGHLSSFDFAVQFLDIGKMTYWGRTRDAGFWTENASIEWNENQAPFHKIAKLTLLGNSLLSAEESNGVYFDVTGNSTVDSRPVGSINRARFPAEVASRKARIMQLGDSQLLAFQLSGDANHHRFSTRVCRLGLTTRRSSCSRDLLGHQLHAMKII